MTPKPSLGRVVRVHFRDGDDKVGIITGLNSIDLGIVDVSVFTNKRKRPVRVFYDVPVHPNALSEISWSWPERV